MTEVVIVGAGPAGSVLATLLARRSVDTLLLDKAVFPRKKVCGDYLSPGSARILERHHLLDQILASGAKRLRGMLIFAPDGTRLKAGYPACADLLLAVIGDLVPIHQLFSLGTLQRAFSKRAGPSCS